jgi:DNA-3-methyladenine glycosylase II
MNTFARYDASVAFLRDLDDDWAGLVAQVGPCVHDPKAAREPYEALVRAIGYQQLTAKAGDAIIARLKALYRDTPFPTPENIMVAEFDALRACGFSREDRHDQGHRGRRTVRSDPTAQCRRHDGR